MVFATSSNTCTTSERERCSLSITCMREMKRCFCDSRSLICSICLVEHLDLGLQLLVARLPGNLIIELNQM